MDTTHGTGAPRRAKKQRYTRKDFDRDLGFKLVPGETIYVIQRSVSKSGMSRKLDLYIMRSGTLLRITWSVAQLLRWSYDKNKDALTVGGCGMDMHFHTVYCLSGAYFGWTDLDGLSSPTGYTTKSDVAKAKKINFKSTDTGYWLKHRTI